MKKIISLRIIAVLCLVVLAAISLTACNTDEQTMSEPPEIAVYDFEGNADMLGKKLIANEDGLIVLTEYVYIKLDKPEGSIINQVFCLANDSEEEADLIFLNETSSPHRTPPTPHNHPIGIGFITSERFPSGFRGSFWAVSTDADGTEYKSNVLDVIWESTSGN